MKTLIPLPLTAAVAFATAGSVLATVIVHARDKDPESSPPALEAVLPNNDQWEHLALIQTLGHAGDVQKTKDAELAATINRLGREGWQLVSVANFQRQGNTDRTGYYFKRRL